MSPREEPKAGNSENKHLAACHGRHLSLAGARITKYQMQHVVLPSEGNEVRRKGRQGFRPTDSTDKAGERTPCGPGGGKRWAIGWTRWSETWPRH